MSHVGLVSQHIQKGTHEKEGGCQGKAVTDLPEEVIDCVFNFLNPVERSQVGEVCRLWGSISRDEISWKQICIARGLQKGERTQTWFELAVRDIVFHAYFKNGRALYCIHKAQTTDFTPDATNTPVIDDVTMSGKAIVGAHRFGEDYKITVWDRETQEVQREPIKIDHDLYFSYVRDPYEAVKLFDGTKNNWFIELLPTNESDNASITMNSKFFVLSHSNSVAVFDIQTETQLFILPIDYLAKVHILDDRLVSQGLTRASNYQMCIWDLKTGDCLGAFPTHPSLISVYALRGNIFVLATGGFGGSTIAVHYLDDSTQDYSFVIPGWVGPLALQENTLAIWTIGNDIIHIVDVNKRQRSAFNYDSVFQNISGAETGGSVLKWDGYTLYFIRGKGSHIIVDKLDFSEGVPRSNQEQPEPLLIKEPA